MVWKRPSDDHYTTHTYTRAINVGCRGGGKVDFTDVCFLSGPGMKKLFEYFKEEIKDQFKGKPPNKL